MTAPDPQPPTHPLLHEDQLDYTPVPRSVALVRHRAARLVTEWGHRDLAGDVALVTSELMTNALLHGSLRGRLIRVRLFGTGTALRVEVSDPRGERLPEPCPPEGADQRGRGLFLVAALADDWGTMPRIVGKTVYAEWTLARRRAVRLVGDVTPYAGNQTPATAGGPW